MKRQLPLTSHQTCWQPGTERPSHLEDEPEVHRGLEHHPESPTSPGLTYHSPNSGTGVRPEDTEWPRAESLTFPAKSYTKHQLTQQNRAELLSTPVSHPLAHIQEAHGPCLESQDCSDRSLRTSELVASFLASINTKYPRHLRGSLSLTPFPHPYRGNTGALSSSEHGQQPPCPAT